MTPARAILLLLALVLPVALWTGSTSYEAAKLLLWGLAVAAWLAMAGVAAWRVRPVPAPARGLVVAAASVLLGMTPGLLVAEAPHLAARAMHWWLLWWLVAIAAAILPRDASDRRRLVACGAAGAAATGVVALLQVAGIAPTTGEWYVPPGIGTLGNENSVAELGAIWLLPSLLLPAGARTMRGRLVACAPAAILLAVLVVSSATGARVAALAAAGFATAGTLLAATRLRARVPVVLGGALLAAALAGGLFVRAALDPGREVSGAGSLPARLFAANHGAERRTDWLVAARILDESPVVGAGAGNYGAKWLSTRAALGRDARFAGLASGAPPVTRAHNEYLQWAAETGLAGAIVLLATAVAGALAWSRAWARSTGGAGRRELLLPAAGLVAAAVIGLVSFPAHRPESGLAVALLVGVLAGRGATAPAGNAKRLPRAFAVLLPLGLGIAALAVTTFRADVLLARGARHFTAGDNHGALRQLEAGVARTPWPGEGRLYLGLALAGEGRTAEARAPLEASLRDRPSFEAPLALAELLIDAGKPQAATSWLAMVEACAPPPGLLRQAGYLRAYMLLREERFREAAAAFAALSAADRLDHRSRLGLGYARARLGDREGAISAYREAIGAIEESLAAPRPATAAARGQALRLQAQLEAARRALASVGG